jgi:hypothetical protein
MTESTSIGTRIIAGSTGRVAGFCPAPLAACCAVAGLAKWLAATSVKNVKNPCFVIASS